MLLIITGAFFSCKKQTGNIVIEGQGGAGDISLRINESLTVTGRTIKEDSLVGNNLNYSLLGTANDPELGIYSNSILTRLSVFQPVADFPNTVVPDSVILHIPFIEGLNFYGNYQTKQFVRISELTTAVTASTTYYQGMDYNKTLGSTLYNGLLYFWENRVIKNNNVDLVIPPGLYIKLASDLANRLANLPKDNYESNEALYAEFKGLVIEAVNNDPRSGFGGFGVFNTASTPTIGDGAKVIVYYNDTSNFIFSMSNKSTTVNVGKSGGYNSNVAAQLNSPAGNFTTVYAQGGNSLKAVVEITNINDLVSDGKIIVNGASMTIFLKDNTVNTTYPAPPRLNLLKQQSGTIRNTLIADQRDVSNPNNLISIGGDLNKKDNSYTFNITRQIQSWANDFVDGKNPKPIFNISIPSDNPITGGRVIIDLTKTKIKVTSAVTN